MIVNINILLILLVSIVRLTLINPSLFSSHNEPNEEPTFVSAAPADCNSVTLIMYLNFEDLVDRNFNVESIVLFMSSELEYSSLIKSFNSV